VPSSSTDKSLKGGAACPQAALNRSLSRWRLGSTRSTFNCIDTAGRTSSSSSRSISRKKIAMPAYRGDACNGRERVTIQLPHDFGASRDIVGGVKGRCLVAPDGWWEECSRRRSGLRPDPSLRVRTLGQVKDLNYENHRDFHSLLIRPRGFLPPKQFNSPPRHRQSSVYESAGAVSSIGGKYSLVCPEAKT
jgi:hypothetical protein